MRIKIIPFLLFLSWLHAGSCTVYKITRGGKTFVGNNEDYWDANSRIWFEKGKAGEYGSMFVGFDNLFAQGGMNEMGLCFDGFSVQQRVIKKKTGKLPFYAHLFKDVLKKCQNTSQVSALLGKYDLSPLNGGMLLYVEKGGRYLIVEADTMIEGNDDNYLLSNFCPSLSPDINKLNIPYYQRGRKMMGENVDTSLHYLTALSDTMHQNFGKGMGGTLYTTIYDLNEGTVNLYFYHDFTTNVKFSLKEELKKKDRILEIPPMFPGNSEGQLHFSQYNKAKQVLYSLSKGDIANDSLKLDKHLESSGVYPMIRVFESDINAIGYELLEKKKVSGAINVFKLNVKYFPKSWNCYDSLGDGYMQAREYKLALLNYKRSVEMNPENQHGHEQIRKLEKRRAG